MAQLLGSRAVRIVSVSIPPLGPADICVWQISAVWVSEGPFVRWTEPRLPGSSREGEPSVRLLSIQALLFSSAKWSY